MNNKKLLDHLYFNKLPQVYRDKDLELKTKPLKRYLSALIEGGVVKASTDIKNVLDLISPESCPDNLLPFLCESYGLDWFEDIEPVYQRRFLQNIGEINRRRGTHSCVNYVVRSLTGLDIEQEYLRGVYENVNGRHLIITLIANTLDQLNNLEVSTKVVERYLETVIPFYIRPHIKNRIATKKLETNIVFAGAISSNYVYNLRQG